MIPGINEPLPFWDPLTTAKGWITDTWTKFLEQVLVPQVRSSTMLVGRFSNGDVPLQDALTTTFLEETIPNTGLYLMTYALQVVAEAGVSSSAALTLSWTSNGVAQSHTFPTITNGTTSDQEQEAFPILADGGTPVAISVSYTSNPANAMQYNLGAALSIVGLPGAVS